MSSIEVLVFDDDPHIADSLVSKVEDAYDGADVKSANAGDFRILLESVNRRRVAWRDDAPEGSATEPNVADGTDVIIVDYDLLSYSETIDTTGSRLAYLLRCFSNCGFIIILNEFGSNIFDFSLGSPTDDFADIHVGDVQIGNPGLWQANFDGYRPWYWPVVPDARKKFEQCVKDVRENLDGPPIVEFLGLDRVIDWIPRRAQDYLSGKHRVEDVTFRDFVVSSRGGIAAKDELISEQLARVAAARIVALLNSIILPEQSALVDAPHLASRLPSLVLSGSGDISMWNRLCNPLNGELDELLADSVRQHKFQRSHWLWRPAWYWPQISNDEAIAEVRNPWSIEEIEWVFCENISRYTPIEFAQEFRARVSPPFIKRFVFNNNSPEARQWFGHIKPREVMDPSTAVYTPQSALSL